MAPDSKARTTREETSCSTPPLTHNPAVILTLQRLISLHPPPSSPAPPPQPQPPTPDPAASSTTPKHHAHHRTLTTLRAPHSPTRQHFLSRHSPLTPFNLTISIEQIALFLHSDATLLSFFETPASSAAVCAPILTRLQSPTTILRRSGDAGMVLQAVVDTVIDIAMPCVRAYEEAIAGLEVEVLSEARVESSRAL